MLIGLDLYQFLKSWICVEKKKVYTDDAKKSQDQRQSASPCTYPWLQVKNCSLKTAHRKISILCNVAIVVFEFTDSRPVIGQLIINPEFSLVEAKNFNISTTQQS